MPQGVPHNVSVVLRVLLYPVSQASIYLTTLDLLPLIVPLPPHRHPEENFYILPSRQREGDDRASLLLGKGPQTLRLALLEKQFTLAMRVVLGYSGIGVERDIHPFQSRDTMEKRYVCSGNVHSSHPTGLHFRPC